VEQNNDLGRLFQSGSNLDIFDRIVRVEVDQATTSFPQLNKCKRDRRDSSSRRRRHEHGMLVPKYQEEVMLCFG
jgi:hypothetical protein